MSDAGIVAPLGPVRAEALKFTLVRPPAGAWTTTCASTVSPRALDRTREEVEPGASVCPTRSKLDCTHTGNGAAVGVTPTPVKPMVAGEFVALLATDTLPVAFPAVEGAKPTFKVAFCPGLRTVPAETPLSLKPAPEMVTPEIVTFELPEFVRVNVRELVLPVLTLPKFKLVGLALSRYVAAALTVRVAAVLVTLPAELLTATVNCSPLSVVAVGGVA